MSAAVKEDLSERMRREGFAAAPLPHGLEWRESTLTLEQERSRDRVLDKE
jgi:hypothetical protein